MTILAILQRCPFPATDGAAIVVRDTLEALKRDGHTIHTFVLLPDGFNADLDTLRDTVDSVATARISTKVKKTEALTRIIRPKDLQAFFGAPTTSSYWVERFASENALEKLLDVVGGLSVDAVLCETLMTACYGIALRTRRAINESVPVVLHAHNVESTIQGTMSRELRRPLWERKYRQRLYHQTRAYEGLVAQRVNVVAALSEVDAEVFRTLAPNTTVGVIEPGVAISDDAPPYQPSNKLCILGSLDWQPNIVGITWFVNEVLPMVKTSIPDVEVHIAGRNPSEEVRDLHNGTSIIVHGEIENAVQFRRDHGISVVPLQSGSGVRIKILESLSDARPVVSTTIGAQGLRLVAGEDIAIADEPKEMARRIIELLNDADKANRLGVHGQRTVKREYSQDSIGTKLTTLLSRSL